MFRLAVPGHAVPQQWQLRVKRLGLAEVGVPAVSSDYAALLTEILVGAGMNANRIQGSALWSSRIPVKRSKPSGFIHPL